MKILYTNAEAARIRAGIVEVEKPKSYREPEKEFAKETIEQIAHRQFAKECYRRLNIRQVRRNILLAAAILVMILVSLMLLW